MQAEKVVMGQEFFMTLPPGTYYIGDHCYVLDDKTYDEVGDLVFCDWHKPGARGTCYDLVIDHPDGKMVVWRTRVGDGHFDCEARYPDSVVPANGLPVDSGGLSIIDMRILDKQAPRDHRPQRRDFGATVTLTGPTTIRVSPAGNLSSLDGMLSVVVDPSEFELVAEQWNEPADED